MRYSIIAMIALFIMFLLTANTSFASIDDSTLQKYADIYNNEIEKAPNVLKGLVGNEEIGISIIRINGSLYKAGLEIENARIDKIVKGGIDSPSISINTTENAIHNVQYSKDPITAFQQEMDQGHVIINSNNAMTNIKLTAALSSPSVLKFFCNTFLG